MKLAKRIIAVIVSIVLFAGMFAVSFVTAKADTASGVVDSGSCGEYLTWALDSEGTLTISGFGEMTDYGISEGGPWYPYRSSIVKVLVEEGVTGIGSSAFFGCSSMTRVTIPSSLSSIGEYAFEACSSLSSVKIPEGVTNISDWTFHDCSALTSVTLPSTINSIGDSAFFGCLSLTSVTIPSGVTSIREYAFGTCISLTSITIPSSVTSIGDAAFSNCVSLTSITIPSSVKSIDGNAFSGCFGLTSIVVEQGNSVYDSRENCNAIIETATNTLISGCANTVIPSNVKSIGNGAFVGCITLTSITIPSSVTRIIGNAFTGCSSLKSITIPSSVQVVSISAFIGCSSLTSIKVEQGNPVYDSRNNCNAIILTASNTLICGCSRTVIPSSVTNIANGAFSYMVNLKSITIPSSVTYIGDSAFYNCSSLTSITIPSSVTSIRSLTFADCSNLTSITIPSSVTSIGDGAFCRSGLTSITIPSSVTSMDGNAFYGCSSLTSIEVAEENPVYDSRDNCNAIIETASNTLICGCSDTVIPSSVTSIAENAFDECEGLTSITIPSGVTSIGACAFYECVDLEDVTIEEGVTTIGEEAFEECPSLTSITIPKSVTSIGSQAIGYIYSDSIYAFEPIPGFVIRGYSGSEAERYANDNGFDFVSLDPVPTIVFNDVQDPSVWYYETVYEIAGTLNEKGHPLMSGYSDGSGNFGPADPLTRQDFAIILHRLANEPEVTDMTNPFTDTNPSGYYYTCVLWAKANGVIAGYNDGRFGVGDKITREQVATILYRFASEYAGIDTSEALAKGDLSHFNDGKAISGWAEEALTWATGAGIITGKANGTLIDARGNAARAEIGAMVLRFIGYMNDAQ